MTTEELPPHRAPEGRDWRMVADIAWAGVMNTRSKGYYESGPITVISECEWMELPGTHGTLMGPTWHISISNAGKRPKPHHVRRALRAFGMTEAEEDNHHPGVARHFFLPVDPAYRRVCECKEDEETIVESDGYRWTTPKGGEDCRGCELERMRLSLGSYGVKPIPCPIHSR